MNTIKKLKVGMQIAFLFAFILFLASCTKSNEIKIALSKGAGSEHYEMYAKWLKRIDSNIVCVDLYNISQEEALEILAECSGIVLTGGPDVHPGRYGKPGDTAICEIDKRRDTLEFALIDLAMKMKLPMLAICRGEQILNVSRGGTLLPDINRDYDTIITHRCPDPDTCFHHIIVNSPSLLNEITGQVRGEVNTNHHQGVYDISLDFQPVAFSQDGLIEAYEWYDKKDKPFLIALQWHPERMPFNSSFSYPIGKRFRDEAKKFLDIKNR